jgi:hypothetical protein
LARRGRGYRSVRARLCWIEVSREPKGQNVVIGIPLFTDDYLPFSLFSQIGVPFATTLHGRLDLPELQPVFNTFPMVSPISISNSQRRTLPHANWLNTIYHGLPKDLLTPQPDK